MKQGFNSRRGSSLDNDCSHHSGVNPVDIVDTEQVEQYLGRHAAPDPNHRGLPVV